MNLPALFFEGLNGTLLFVCLVLMLMFGRFVIDNLLSFKFTSTAYRQSAAAIAFFVFLCGEALIRAPVWFIRYLEDSHADASRYAGAAALMSVAGLVLQIIGGIWMVRELSPRRWSWRAWAATIAAAFAFGFGLALTH